MPSHIALSKRNDIAIKLTLNKDPETIAEEEHISVRSVQRFKKNLVHHGHTYTARDGSQGRWRLINPEMKQVHAEWWWNFA